MARPSLGNPVAVDFVQKVIPSRIEVMGQLKEGIADFNAAAAKRDGLCIPQDYDETEHITDSINMLRNKLLLGVPLATAVLWWFLPRKRVTMMVALGIPISLFATFIAMTAARRTSPRSAGTVRPWRGR